jgi:hypothetical protein
MYFQHDEAPPHFSREVRNFLNDRFPGRWIVSSGPHNWSPMSPDVSALDYCVWRRKKEITYSEMRFSVAIWMWQNGLGTSNASYSEPSGKMLEAKGGIFEKPVLSTVQCKLRQFFKLLLFYTFNCYVLCWTCLFFKFIFNNPYPLSYVSSSHNSVTAKNRTHVYMTFFDHRDLVNHLLH